jgi:ferritin-like protein
MFFLQYATQSTNLIGMQTNHKQNFIMNASHVMIQHFKWIAPPLREFLTQPT